MFLSKHKILVVVLMLLLFMSQAIASAVVPCNMKLQKQSQNTAVTSNHTHASIHSTHIEKSSSSEWLSCDCNTQDCQCPMGSCFSIIVPTAPTAVNTMPSSQQITASLLPVTRQIPTSLYRPPISRS